MNTQDILTIAKKHAIKKELAAPAFFEGALLGNGALGVVVCSRPDGIVLYFGHNDIWDIRIDESHADKIGNFDEVWNKILNTKGRLLDYEWYHKYYNGVTASYFKPYPRPYPASALYLFFDRKEYEVLGHSLDISCGLVTITLLDRVGNKYYVQIFVSQQSDTAFCRTVDAEGKEVEIFHRMRLEPHTPDEGLPTYTVLSDGFEQLLPYNDYNGQVRPNVDRGFSVHFRINGETENDGLVTAVRHMTGITVQIKHGFYDEIHSSSAEITTSYEEEFEKTTSVWQEYWQCSGVQLEDEELEHIWYINTYFIRCVLNGTTRCPGLFGNWMFNNIGTAWHGDYHMNYNTQQVFWGLMGANRQELHLPYIRLAEDLVSVSKAWAKDFYGLEGLCFPHSAYPVPMKVMPYPSPDWGWEIFETPWTVQSLWWHYTYTKDVELLRTRIYPLMREATLFLIGYMTREGSNPKQDSNYHIFPTIVPELYGLSEGLRLNCDGIADLTLTKFLFRAMLQAVVDLGIEEKEAPLIADIRKILAAFPDYPTANSRFGKVYLSVENEEPDKVVYNCPANLMPIFPGEDIDAQTATEKELEIAKTSWLHHYNEGGNDLVFYHLIGARLGILDIEQFKRNVRYCQLPNESATDRVTMAGGRYEDTRDFDFMSYMGVWIENFSLYAVVNECLIWGHNDIVELFPNWDMNKAASFCSMRTKGAFLVDSSCCDGKVEQVTVLSEQGGDFKLKNPWNSAVDQNGNVYTDEVIILPMNKGETLTLTEKIS